MQKLEVINPYNLNQLELLNDFCLQNNIDNIAKPLKEKTTLLSEDEYQKTQNKSPLIDEYLILKEKDKVIDYTHLKGEKDIKKCFVTFPNILNKPKKRKIINNVLEYAFDSLSMEEVFITTNDDTIIEQLEEIGFMTLGNDNENISFVIGREEVKEENKKIGRR